MRWYMKKSRENHILYAKSGIEKILFAVVFVLFLLYALSMIYPFVWLVINSLKEGAEYSIGMALREPFSMPENPTFANYAYAFSRMEDKGTGTNFIGMIFNSVWFTCFSSLTAVFFSSVTGYVFAKYEFKLKRVFYAIIIFSMTIPIIGTMGVSFKFYNDIQIYDTVFFPIITNMGGIGMNFLIMYGFFKNLPWSYAEAVYVDGGDDFVIFFKIMLPMAKTLILTLFIMASIGVWNDYMTVILYMPSYPTIASGLYKIEESLVRTGNSPIYFAALVLSVLPILIVFICFSDLIMKNFTMGGLKG